MKIPNQITILRDSILHNSTPKLISVRPKSKLCTNRSRLIIGCWKKILSSKDLRIHITTNSQKAVPIPIHIQIYINNKHIKAISNNFQRRQEVVALDQTSLGRILNSTIIQNSRLIPAKTSLITIPNSSNIMGIHSTNMGSPSLPNKCTLIRESTANNSLIQEAATLSKPIDHVVTHISKASGVVAIKTIQRSSLHNLRMAAEVVALTKNVPIIGSFKRLIETTTER